MLGENMTGNILAIDQGTSGTKAVVVDAGEVVAVEEVPIRPDYRDGGVVGVSGVPPCQQEERREQSDTVCRVGGGDPVEPWCAVGEMVHPFEQAVIQFVLSFQTPSAVTVARVVRRVIESSR
jgi:hypothetical protein